MLVHGLGDKYDKIKWDSDRHSNASRLPEDKRSKRFSSFNVIPDDFPPEVQGRIDWQSGIRLTSRSEFRRKLKEKGMVQI